MSHPEAEFDALAKDLQIANQEMGNLTKKLAEAAEKESKLQKQVRDSEEAVLLCKELADYKNDLEKEFQHVRGKLEQYDPEYRWVNSIMYRIVESLRGMNKAISRAFEEFDQDKNGHLDKGEMI